MKRAKVWVGVKVPVQPDPLRQLSGRAHPRIRACDASRDNGLSHGLLGIRRAWRLDSRRGLAPRSRSIPAPSRLARENDQVRAGPRRRDPAAQDPRHRREDGALRSRRDLRWMGQHVQDLLLGPARVQLGEGHGARQDPMGDVGLRSEPGASRPTACRASTSGRASSRSSRRP